MPTNPYDSQAIAGYNSSPPPDDGSKVDANKLEWAKHKTKLGDPIKTLAESINSELLSAFGDLIITTDIGEENAIAGLEILLEELVVSRANRAVYANQANRADVADTVDAVEDFIVKMEEFAD